MLEMLLKDGQTYRSEDSKNVGDRGNRLKAVQRRDIQGHALAGEQV